MSEVNSFLSLTPQEDELLSYLDAHDYELPPDQVQELDEETKEKEEDTDTASVFHRPPEYANERNYTETVKYLSSALASAGYPSPINVDNMTVGDKVQIVNCIYKLIVDRQTMSETLHELRDQTDQYLSEQTKLKERISQLQTQVKNAERTQWETENKRRLEETVYRQEEKKFKFMINDLEKRNIMIQNRDNQYKHELRKREKKTIKLYKINLRVY